MGKRVNLEHTLVVVVGVVMAIEQLTFARLKQIKNAVIGNPMKKLELSQDEVFMQGLIQCLTRPPNIESEPRGSQDDIRTEAAHIISSLSYGPSESLQGLLEYDAVSALLQAVGSFSSFEKASVKAAFGRALKTVAGALADVYGPPQWGLPHEHTQLRLPAKNALDIFFEPSSLDAYLPLLVDAAAQTTLPIAQLLALAVKDEHQRNAVTAWLPPSDRQKDAKGKRGWELPERSNSNAPSRLGGWVIRNLIELLGDRDPKIQEAVLSAIATLSKDNGRVAAVFKASDTHPAIVPQILSFVRSPSVDVQVAACLCVTNIVRAPTPIVHAFPIHGDSPWKATTLTTLCRLISSPNTPDQLKTKSCFILHQLTIDDIDFSHTAFEQGALEKLADIVKQLTPVENVSPEWDEAEPEVKSRLREAALTTIAALCVHDGAMQRAVADKLILLPVVQVCLRHKHVGVRYAACQCLRSLSRSTELMRTNIADSDVGMIMFEEVFMNIDEDHRVTNAALMAVCNLFNGFSPLRSKYLDKGAEKRIIDLFNSGDPSLQLNALWAMKNLLSHSDSEEEKARIMELLTWERFTQLLQDPDAGMQEQAWHMLRNFVNSEQGINLAFNKLGADRLLGLLSTALQRDEDVMIQAAYALANLCNGDENHLHAIVTYPAIIPCLERCLASSFVRLRRPAIACVVQLFRHSNIRRIVLRDGGVVKALRYIRDWSVDIVSLSPGGGNSAAPVSAGGIGGGMMVDTQGEAREVRGMAREVLHWLDVQERLGGSV